MKVKHYFDVFHQLIMMINLSGLTSLHYASQNVHESVVHSLVKFGADIHATDDK